MPTRGFSNSRKLSRPTPLAYGPGLGASGLTCLAGARGAAGAAIGIGPLEDGAAGTASAGAGAWESGPWETGPAGARPAGPTGAAGAAGIIGTIGLGGTTTLRFTPPPDPKILPVKRRVEA